MRYRTEDFIYCHFPEEAALDACVDGFTKVMKERLRQKLREGKVGWDSLCQNQDTLVKEIETRASSSPVDAANYAMFLWNLNGGAK